MSLTAGELVAYLKLNMASYTADLTRAKSLAMTTGEKIGQHLHVKPTIDTGTYQASLNGLVQDAARAANRINNTLRDIHAREINLPGFGGEARMRGQLQSLISEV